MNVKRSSSPIRLSASASAVGCSAAKARPRSASAVEVGEGQHVLEGGQLAAHGFDLLELRLVLDEHPDGVGVGEDVAAVLGRRVRVDRRRYASDEREREVEEAPLDTRAREDPERVALADAERQQAVRELVHPSRGLCQGHGRPVAVALREIQRIGAA